MDTGACDASRIIVPRSVDCTEHGGRASVRLVHAGPARNLADSFDPVCLTASARFLSTANSSSWSPQNQPSDPTVITEGCVFGMFTRARVYVNFGRIPARKSIIRMCAAS